MANGKGGGFFAGFLIGSIVGGAAAVLLTQEETRDLLVGKAREAGNFAKDTSDDLRGKVGDVSHPVASQRGRSLRAWKDHRRQRARQRGRRGRRRQE